MGPREASESAREREIYKYYQPTLFPRPDEPPSPPQSTRDAALTAFAQLGALRLNAQRAVISLVAREYQHIIAEATRTLSLRDDAVYEGDDQIYWGERTVARNIGPFAAALDNFTGKQGTRCNHLFVQDLLADPRFNILEPVGGSSLMRFLIAVPLVTSKGFIIGTFCVIDNKPRNEMTSVEINFMKDLAATIMAHLESERAKQQHTRAEKMIRGLGLYVEGKSSLREWWLQTGHKTEQASVDDKMRHGESMDQQADQQFGVRDTPDPLAASKATMSPSESRKSDGFEISDLRGTKSSSPSMSRSLLGSDEDFGPRLRSGVRLATSETPRAIPMYKSTTNPTQASSIASRETHDSLHQSFDQADGMSGAQLQEAVLFDELKDSFARASNLIRESIGVEGVLFLDASIGTFGGSARKHNARAIAPAPLSRNPMADFMTSSSDEIQSARGLSKQDRHPAKRCGILGYSTAARSSLYMHEPSDLHLSVSESLLRRLLRQYPYGKVFNFDDTGSLSTGEDEASPRDSDGHIMNAEKQAPAVDDVQQHRRKKKRTSRAEQAKEILSFLPGCRCVAFFPMWDAHKERWFAGSLAWTKDPTRIIDPDEELTYLASFGNSIMAEVSRLNALLSSQLKTSFVSSISHELRSPLHGILAGVEFLQDSPVNEHQQEMVTIINSCGRTLSDTIDHVLEFAKLQGIYKGREESKRRPSQPMVFNAGATSPENQSIPAATPVDLSILTEEVLSAVYFASGFGKNPSNDGPHPTLASVGPMIIVSIDWRSKWEFKIDPGAWRRLIMNIFGNALKYTEKGFIHLSLAGDDVQSQNCSHVTLTVTDSGRGISKEFLNHHLYTPFVQEDALSEGTGLGLSIVRHIVNDLQGSIDIYSRQEAGTEVIISLPLTKLESLSAAGDDEDQMAQIKKQMRGLEACLIGFDIFPNIMDEPTGILSLEATQAFRFKDSVKDMLRGWFGMTVSAVSTLERSNATLNLIMESTFDDMLSAGSIDLHVDANDERKSILLVLCTKAYQSRPSITHGHYDIAFVQQPFGPHKLAKILAGYQLLSIPADRDPISSLLSPELEVSYFSKRPASDVSTSQFVLPTSPPRSRLELSTSSSIASRIMPSPPLEPYSVASSGASVVSSITWNPAKPHSPKITASSSSQYVLLVEDNAINLRLLVNFMHKLGIAYDTAENGLVAVQQYQGATRPFNLILMDISMPVMDGLQSSRKIRSHEREMKRERVPIVAVTGAASESIKREAYSAGIDRFLTKPVSLKVVRELLKDYAPILNR